MILEFLKIKKDNIFCEDFNHLSKNNIVDFSTTKINVFYAPNGVGKSSLCKILEGKGELLLKYAGVTYDHSTCNSLFHVINDQNNRNIIKGNAKDFLLGDDIVKEFNLKEWLDQNFAGVFANLKNNYKETLNISKKIDKKIDWLEDKTQEIVKTIVKSGSKPSDIQLNDFIILLSSMNKEVVDDYASDKFDFIKSDLNTELINELLRINNITRNHNFSKIEQCDDAMMILNKYHDSDTCIVCDNENINVDGLIASKNSLKETVIRELDIKGRNILNNIIKKIGENDPFEIKRILTDAITSGNMDIVNDLIDSIKYYKNIFSKISNIYLVESISQEFIDKYNEYKTMLSGDLNFSDEDILFIESFIENNINKEIKLERKDNKIVITLDSENLLGVDRSELKLSSGEQNFISLTFELLKAKNSNCEIVVIDDPISSFDSIFKNKLAYSIVKFLSEKKVIVLTHNIDLLRLLNYQMKDSFGLFLFNNFENQENGFIQINDNEKNIMISIPELLSFIRNPQTDYEVNDEKLFLLSLIPFMRGYSNYINDVETKNRLTKLMHGYCSDLIDLKSIYNSIFSKSVTSQYDINVDIILSVDINSLPEIINASKYPLLNRVLTNNFIYLYLRLKTEKVLTDKFHINTNRHDQLSSIIYESFKLDTDENKKNRIFFFSKKTLLNEFNHFDGNMNIFQPAIDISEDILKKEKDEIINKLSTL